MVQKDPIALTTAGLLGAVAIGALAVLLIPPVDPRAVILLTLLGCGTTLAVWWGMTTAGHTDTTYW